MNQLPDFIDNQRGQVKLIVCQHKFKTFLVGSLGNVEDFIDFTVDNLLTIGKSFNDFSKFFTLNS